MVISRTLFAAMGIALLCCGQGTPAVTPEKEAAIRQLLQVTGAGDLGIQVMAQMGEVMVAQAGPEFRDFWADFMEEIDPKELSDMIVPIYAKHFDQADIEEMVRFYQTPLGQRAIKKLPEIIAESMAVGSEWGQRIGAQALERFKQRSQDSNK